MVSRYFRKYGFAPATVIDVGALPGTPFLYKSFPNAKFILVNPLDESRAAVTKAWSGRIDFDFHVCGASEDEGEVDLTIPVGRPALATASSARNNDRSEGAERRRVPTRRPDDLVAGGATGPYGLKVGSDGHELSVLKGGLGILAEGEFVITETSIKRRSPEG